MVRRWDVMVRSFCHRGSIGMLPGGRRTNCLDHLIQRDPAMGRVTAEPSARAGSRVCSPLKLQNPMLWSRGSLIPMLALGIPGNVNAAVILGRATVIRNATRDVTQSRMGPAFATAFMIGTFDFQACCSRRWRIFIIIRLCDPGPQRCAHDNLAPTHPDFCLGRRLFPVTNSSYGVEIMAALGIGEATRCAASGSMPHGLVLGFRSFGPIAEENSPVLFLIAQAQGSYWTLVMRPDLDWCWSRCACCRS